MTQSFDLERELTPDEIQARDKLRDDLDEERDGLLTAIEDRRREIRGFTAKRKKIEAQLRDVRRELKTGKVFESPQGTLALDIQPTDAFEVRYPMPRDFERLHSELAVVLQGVLVPSIEKLERLCKHPSTGIFQTIGHWTRTELAYINAKEHPDLALPSRIAMPEKLYDLRMFLGQKVPKKATRKAPARKATKTRPASGTPIRLGRRRSKRGEARA